MRQEAGNRRSAGPRIRAATNWIARFRRRSANLADVLSQLQALRGHGRTQGARQLNELWQRLRGWRSASGRK